MQKIVLAILRLMINPEVKKANKKNTLLLSPNVKTYVVPLHKNEILNRGIRSTIKTPSSLLIIINLSSYDFRYYMLKIIKNNFLGSK
jgi:hypothetical protein